VVCERRKVATGKGCCDCKRSGPEEEAMQWHRGGHGDGDGHGHLRIVTEKKWSLWVQ